MSKIQKRIFLPPLDRPALKEAALSYLSRFAATERKTAQILNGKIRRWGLKAEKAGMPEAAILEIQENAQAEIPGILAEMVSAGAINDLEFGRSKVRGSAGRKSRRAITANLAAKGLDGALLEEALEKELGEAGEEKSALLELSAAVRLARKRKIGPFAKENSQRGETDQPHSDPFASPQKSMKEAGILARAGFSAETAGRVLKMTPQEALEILEKQGLELF